MAQPPKPASIQSANPCGEILLGNGGVYAQDITPGAITITSGDVDFQVNHRGLKYKGKTERDWVVYLVALILTLQIFSLAVYYVLTEL